MDADNPKPEERTEPEATIAELNVVEPSTPEPSAPEASVSESSIPEISTPEPKYIYIDAEDAANVKCTIRNGVCIPVAINGLIAKVHLQQFDFDDFFANKHKYLPAKRGRKRKYPEVKPEVRSEPEVIVPSSQESNCSAEPVVKKRGRGRPRKIRPPVDETTTEDADGNAQTPDSTLYRKSSTDSLNQFNGNKRGTTYKSASRVIKPNRKLQDFVIASSVRYYSQSPRSATEDDEVPAPKPVSRRGRKKLNRGAHLAGEGKREGEAVRSFLPMFDSSLSEDEEMENIEKRRYQKQTEKENQLNMRWKVNSVKCVSSSSVEENQVVHQYPGAKGYQALKKCEDVKFPFTKVNGSNAIMKYRNQNTSYASHSRIIRSADVDFNKLVRSLKLIKLPAANWKIRIVISKQQTITELTFTNKEVNERCIKFSQAFSGYIITFGGCSVRLLGAPTKIGSSQDVSILLDIIHNISPKDPALEYIAGNEKK